MFGDGVLASGSNARTAAGWGPTVEAPERTKRPLKSRKGDRKALAKVTHNAPRDLMMMMCFFLWGRLEPPGAMLHSLKLQTFS